ncbi:unnamed protein product, partial [Fusarium langsethiae]
PSNWFTIRAFSWSPKWSFSQSSDWLSPN